MLSGDLNVVKTLPIRQLFKGKQIQFHNKRCLDLLRTLKTLVFVPHSDKVSVKNRHILAQMLSLS